MIGKTGELDSVSVIQRNLRDNISETLECLRTCIGGKFVNQSAGWVNKILWYAVLLFHYCDSVLYCKDVCEVNVQYIFECEFVEDSQGGNLSFN